MKKLFLLFSVANTILLLFPMALMAQQTHVLEPSIMEVAYHEISGKYNDDYDLRVGKSMSQYFSYHKLRDDSLSSNAQTSMIILQEMLDEANNRNDASKQRASGPDHGDYFYRNQANNTFDTYTSFMGQGYKITEPIPVQDWNIVIDSTRQILGYPCDSFESRFCLLNKFSYEIFCFLFLSMYVHFANKSSNRHTEHTTLERCNCKWSIYTTSSRPLQLHSYVETA